MLQSRERRTPTSAKERVFSSVHTSAYTSFLVRMRTSLSVRSLMLPNATCGVMMMLMRRATAHPRSTNTQHTHSLTHSLTKLGVRHQQLAVQQRRAASSSGRMCACVYDAYASACAPIKNAIRLKLRTMEMVPWTHIHIIVWNIPRRIREP